MSSYEVSLERNAIKALRGVPTKTRERIVEAIDGLAEEPRPSGCTALKGANALYRVRVGDYRIIYEVRDAQLRVLVIRLGHRRDIYRKR